MQIYSRNWNMQINLVNKWEMRSQVKQLWFVFTIKTHAVKIVRFKFGKIQNIHSGLFSGLVWFMGRKNKNNNQKKKKKKILRLREIKQRYFTSLSPRHKRMFYVMSKRNTRTQGCFFVFVFFFFLNTVCILANFRFILRTDVTGILHGTVA